MPTFSYCFVLECVRYVFSLVCSLLGLMLQGSQNRFSLQGNSLLVGVGGSGKQSLSKLAAYTAGCEVFEITLTRGYDETMFREDLKKLYEMLGADNKKVSLMSLC